MLFDFVKDIAYEKKGDLLDLSEDELQFNPYMVQRFVSMFSGLTCHIINETSNKKLNFLEKSEIYKLLLCVIPKQNQSYAKYIKKHKDDLVLTEQEKQVVEMLKRRHNISNREIQMYIDKLGLDVDKLTRGLN